MARRLARSESDLDAMALRYLDRFPTSTARMRRHLKGKLRDSVAEEAATPTEAAAWIESIIARLTRVGLLDDLSYARGRAGALARRGKAARFIRADLRQRGLSDADIAGAIEALAEESGNPELTAACTLARRRRLGPWFRGADRRAARQKHLATLGRAGFGFDIARQVVDADSVEDLLEAQSLE